MNSEDMESTHTLIGGVYTRRPRNQMVAFSDDRERCGSEQCDGTCSDHTSKNYGAEDFLRRLQGRGD